MAPETIGFLDPAIEDDERDSISSRARCCGSGSRRGTRM
jgi:hypothetical protein